MTQTQQKKRFILVHLIPPRMKKEEGDKELQELISLVDTYGGANIVHIIQRRERPDSKTYVGKGKAAEITELIKKEKIEVVVINGIVKPGVLFDLEKMFWASNKTIGVWDRVDLILHIFDKHAHTAEAKLQIELATMHHMGPRIYGMGMEMSRQGGGIGTRGLGETNTELMKRHWRNEIKNVQERLQKLVREHENQMQRRAEYGFKTISIVGYTNAGKTTFFNALTRKNKLAEDALFATLDSSVGKIFLKNLNKEVLVSDTIGFIQNLPAKLVDAFKSTLMESINADVLLHVIDASDPKMDEKIAVVEGVLSDLKISDKKRIYVFNKIDKETTFTKDDLLFLMEKYHEFTPQFVSAKTGDGIPELIEVIEKII